MIGVAVALAVTLIGHAIYAGLQGKGFKIGVDVQIGWFGLPVGANFVYGAY